MTPNDLWGRNARISILARGVRFEAGYVDADLLPPHSIKPLADGAGHTFWKARSPKRVC